ncbi:FAD:protein FMN transferase [Solwaraspora sp. WMMD937]|uniref:FAD:protein FMN transferase n=1 Tax=Solwaraspora sp. WMMD937 TaxID=3016090 RepID=UPI00249AD1FF|nr:FAD:protein FMN transferase [Solwaraspora sp. WMMD937]WFE24342.1 FAD:protein FMN transferase [Solwaraspora sp. WMMD937]
MLAYRAAQPEPPDLRIGPTPGAGAPTGSSGTAAPADDNRPAGQLVARHTVATSTTEYQLVLVGSERIGRRGLSEAIGDAVAELRAIDVTYSPLRPNSLVSLLRRGEVAAEVYPPLADIVHRCEAMRMATEGWFDPWAVPGGFDPAGMIKGWAIERAAGRLRAAGITDYAVVSGGDLVVRGRAPHGGPWRIALQRPLSADTGDGPAGATPGSQPTTVTMVDGAIGTSGLTAGSRKVVDPHTGAVVERDSAAMVIGADLAVADGYATALFAAGPAGRAWFPTVDGYNVLDLVGERRSTLGAAHPRDLGK